MVVGVAPCDPPPAVVSEGEVDSLTAVATAMEVTPG